MKPILTIGRDDNGEVNSPPPQGEVLAAYLQIREGKVDSTSEEIPGIVMIDRDEDGKILGIELLDLDIK